MAKPICVIYYNPYALAGQTGKEPLPHEISEGMSKKLSDYHVLAIPSYKSLEGDGEAVELKVFYEKDFTEIQYQELKELIMASLPEPISS